MPPPAVKVTIEVPLKHEIAVLLPVKDGRGFTVIVTIIGVPVQLFADGVIL